MSGHHNSEKTTTFQPCFRNGTGIQELPARVVQSQRSAMRSKEAYFEERVSRLLKLYGTISLPARSNAMLAAFAALPIR
jgi:hypothetical protein